MIGFAWVAGALLLGLVVGPALRCTADRQTTWAAAEFPDHVPFADPGADALPELLTADVGMRLRSA